MTHPAVEPVLLVGFTAGSLLGLLATLVLGAVVLGLGLLFLRSVLWFLGLLVGRLGSLASGLLADSTWLVLGLLALPVNGFMALTNLIAGRWQAANRRADRFGRNLAVVLGCVVAVVVYRPLRLFGPGRFADSVIGRLPSPVIDCRRLLPRSSRPASTPAGPGGASVDPPDPRVIPSPHGSPAFEGYRVLGRLPSGGSGASLWVAEPLDPGSRPTSVAEHRVVIKSFDLRQGSTLPSIVRESRALEGARSLGLVLEHHLSEERFWYAMPYHPGRTLTRVVEDLHRTAGPSGLEGGGLGLGLDHVRDLLRDLDRFHRAGLWHKDVKPDNLVVHDGRAHLVDLGLVTPLTSGLTLTTHGTEYFRDPELVRMSLRGVKVEAIDGARFDVYAAGAVLYFVLANDFPAQGGLTRFPAPVPPVLDWIVRRAMADYDQRYGSVGEMLADLDTACRLADVWSARPADLPSLGGTGVPSGVAAGSLDSIPRPVASPATPPPPVVVGDASVRSPEATDSPRTVRPSSKLLLIGACALVLLVSWLVADLGAVGASAPGSRWRDEVLRLPGEGLSLLARRKSDPGGEITLLGWNHRAVESLPSLRASIESTIDDLLLDGYRFEGVAEPPIPGELRSELRRFPMPVTRHDGSPGPSMGFFRVADRLGLDRFSFVVNDDGVPRLRNHARDDEAWRLSVALLAPGDERIGRLVSER